MLHRLVMTLLMLPLLAAPAAAMISDPGFQLLDAHLARLCPAKHLELLSPADLNGAIEDFRDGRSHSARARLMHANDEGRACAHNIAGVACENGAYLRAMQGTGMLTQFAQTLCRMPKACRAQSECDAAH